MVRTQIQLPDDLHEDLRAICKEREMTVTEAIRRGTEWFVQSHPRLPPNAKKPWTFPKGRAMGGPFLVPVEEWRELANEREIFPPVRQTKK